MSMTVALVSCVKSKRDHAARAEDMYVSTLFQGMREYAQKNADAWFILSAQYGLLEPDEIILPYERTLNKLPKSDRLAWAGGVGSRLLNILPAKASILMLAGERYREYLIPFLTSHQFAVEIPMDGLSFGRQLNWLNRQLRND